MNPSKTLQLIKARRVVRRFAPDERIEQESLDRILEAAVWAPLSIYHPQGWRFIALRGAERHKAVEIITQDHTILKYVRHMYDHALIGADEKWPALAEYFGKTLGDAPVILVCLVESDQHAARMEHNLDASWCAAQNMMLQAEAEGLSTGVLSLGSEEVRGQLVRHLGYDPVEWRVSYVLNLGHGIESPAPIEREISGVIELRG